MQELGRTTVYGHIDQDEDVNMYLDPQTRQYLRDNKGRKIIVEIVIFDEKPGDALRRYIRGVMVPQIMGWYREHGYIYDNEQVYQQIKKLSPCTNVYDPLHEQMRLRGWNELTNKERSQFMEDVIRYFAEEHGFVINYPNEYEQQD